MNYFQTKNHRFAIQFISILITCVFFTISAHAQISPNYGKPSPIETDMRFRDWALERMKQRKASTPVEQKLAYDQLKKDFAELQELNNDIIKAKSAGETTDFGLIAKKAGEIHKIANRLNSTLLLPEKKEETAKITNPPSNPNVNLTAVLTILDNVIFKFVKNPMFKNVEVIDVNDSKGAKEDIDRILLLSERAQKKAESMNKTSAKQ